MQMLTKEPKVTLVGAGPGDPDLITIKGLKAIQQADVILYDALVNVELLNHAPESAERVYVGKRAGSHKFSQDLINKMIVDYAYRKGNLVRLKGGDSFIFGRGNEEIAYAKQHGLQVEVVPGISSATGVPAINNIPLTQRGINESFWVVTGTTKSGEISRDLELAIQSTATVVILMGVRKLPEISRMFINADKGSIPAAVIMNGSLEEQKVAYGNMFNIVSKAEEQQIGSPAIIIVGEVAAAYEMIMENDLAYAS